MKKFLVFVLMLFAVTIVACDDTPKLYVLNWGDYINEDLIDAFEEEYKVKVVYDAVDSNETMYSRLIDKVSPYDIIVPSDYMVEKMKNENLLQQIDYTKIENYSDGMYVKELQEIMDSDVASSYKDYYIPYFWGALGIMYSTRKEGVKEAVEANGFKVFFEQNLLPSGSKVGMYNASRDAFAAAQLYLGYSLNTTDTKELEACSELLKKTSFHSWGNDNLKTDIAAGNLDVALVYSGDFFDTYYLYSENEQDINFDMFVPTTANNVFFDGLVIPTSSRQTELAYQFINFMMNHQNSLDNALYVGYCPTIQTVYDAICADEEMADVVAMNAYHPDLVVKGAKEKAEVYKDLGSSVYELVERLFIAAKQG